MEQEKTSGLFGSILVVLILLGLVVYYLSNKNQMAKIPDGQSTSETNTDLNENQQTSMEEVSAEAELEAEIEELDTGFEDMNAEDLDM
jgi:hypothetical protein